MTSATRLLDLSSVNSNFVNSSSRAISLAISAVNFGWGETENK